MAEHFDAVIVGSGFGGSVMAYRLAEAGLRVCVLERGRAYPPGSFPRSPIAMRDNFWDPSEGRFGLFKPLAVQGHRCAGLEWPRRGSLIYANVLIRKDERWFVREDLRNGGHEYWPVTREQLDPHYDSVEQMLNGAAVPSRAPAILGNPEMNALRLAAAKTNSEWLAPKLAVAFRRGRTPGVGLPIADEVPNMHGAPRVTCRLCGECNLGCNYGSKATLDLNYLTRANALDAEIRVGAEVRAFTPRDRGGYSIEYVQRELDSESSPKRRPRTKTMTSTHLVLAAGALGLDVPPAKAGSGASRAEKPQPPSRHALQREWRSPHFCARGA